MSQQNQDQKPGTVTPLEGMLIVATAVFAVWLALEKFNQILFDAGYTTGMRLWGGW